jgi:hypothetical protein
MESSTFCSYLQDNIWNENNIEYDFLKEYPDVINILPNIMISYKSLYEILKENYLYIDNNSLFKNTWLNYFKWLLTNSQRISDTVGR